MFCALALLALSGVGAYNVFEYNVEDNTSSKLPELYQIDDYDSCLSRPGALYCVGTFRLTADRQAPSYRYYRMIEEYSSERRHFNRTLLHRGYCLSNRCPGFSNGADREWFSNCAQTQELSHGLKLDLQSYHCTPNDQTQDNEELDKIFLWIVAVLFVLNVLGTLYDVNVADEKKNKVLMSWSIRSNWKSLKNSVQTHKDPRVECLSTVEGLRVVLHTLFIACHVVVVYHQLYLKNPQHVEQLYYQSVSYFWRNGTSAVHAFVMGSSFLYTHSQIISTKKNTRFSQLPLAAMKRISRLMPVHLLVVGFAATWWRYTGDGPLWPSLVIQESDICRRKFPLHVLHLHNFIDNYEHCMLQTWSFAVDLQLFIAVYLLMTILMRTRQKPIPVLSVLFVVFSVLNGLLAFWNEWKPTLFFAFPETLRGSLRNSRSFSDFYMSPLNSLPAYLLGIILAHVHNYIQNQDIKLGDYKLYVWCYHLSVPLIASWIICGEWFYERRSSLTIAVFAAIERPVFLVLVAILFIGIFNNLDNVLRRLMLWRGWQPLGRMSLAMMTVHWCVIKTLLASRQTLTDFNLYNVTMDTLTTLFFSYCLALPLTLLVEMPLMKTFISMQMD